MVRASFPTALQLWVLRKTWLTMVPHFTGHLASRFEARGWNRSVRVQLSTTVACLSCIRMAETSLGGTQGMLPSAKPNLVLCTLGNTRRPADIAVLSKWLSKANGTRHFECCTRRHRHTETSGATCSPCPVMKQTKMSKVAHTTDYIVYMYLDSLVPSVLGIVPVCLFHIFPTPFSQQQDLGAARKLRTHHDMQFSIRSIIVASRWHGISSSAMAVACDIILSHAAIRFANIEWFCLTYPKRRTIQL